MRKATCGFSWAALSTLTPTRGRRYTGDRMGGFFLRQASNVFGAFGGGCGE